MEHGREESGAASATTVWLLSCESLEDDHGQSDLENTAFLGVFSSEEKALEAERAARTVPGVQTYLDAYVIDEVNWETEFTVE
jgi:hypothetical protein